MNTNQSKKVKFLQEDYQKILLIVLGLAVLGTAAYSGMKYRAISLAEKHESRGFGALAVDTLEPYRHNLVSSERGCRVIINAYFLAKKPDLLEWAAQACISSGQEIIEAYIGYASAFEMTGRDQEALRLLSAVMERFQKLPDIYYRIGQILQRNKREPDAIQAYSKAASVAPDNADLSLQVLQNLIGLQAWKDAKPIAERLKSLNSPNPTIKFVLGRVMLQNGDHAAAKALADQGRELLAKAPQNKAELEKAFADVLAVK